MTQKTDPLPDGPLVSVVMPAYNTGLFIGEAIRSVLAQSHTHLELIIVNDGSTDDTAQVIGQFTDPRIVAIHKAHGGVGAARNAALDKVRGEFVCFMDSDDHMPEGSIAARLRVLQDDPSLDFADGAVSIRDGQLDRVIRTYMPVFTGEPFRLLVRFDQRCFFGNTWMIRREAIGKTRFAEGLTHVEDLLFLLCIARGKRYAFTTETVLWYRVTGGSSMSRVRNLERSYHTVLRWMARQPDISFWERMFATYKVRRMMAGAYLKAGQYLTALKAAFLPIPTSDPRR